MKLVAWSALVLGLACGGRSPAAQPTKAVPLGPKNAWTWVDVAGASCGDGSPTGFAVNPGDAPDVLTFLDGGGACWDYTTCFTLALASPGPFGEAQLDARLAAFAGTFFDRADPSNPFRSWTYVFIPYCTGDLHAGDADASYRPLGPDMRPSRRWQHHGRANIRADLLLLSAAFPDPLRLVVSGASAGGYGALLEYDTFRAAWPAARTFLVDDSGPPLEGDAIQPALHGAWRAAWRLDTLLDPICARCRDDLSALVTAVASRHPDDRLALLSSLQDRVIRAFVVLPPTGFEAALRMMVHDRFDPLPSARTFLVPGEAHALLAAPGSFTAGGVPLATWLAQMVDGDPAWRSVGP